MRDEHKAEFVDRLKRPEELMLIYCTTNTCTIVRHLALEIGIPEIEATYLSDCYARLFQPHDPQTVCWGRHWDSAADKAMRKGLDYYNFLNRLSDSSCKRLEKTLTDCRSTALMLFAEMVETDSIY